MHSNGEAILTLWEYSVVIQLLENVMVYSSMAL